MQVEDREILIIDFSDCKEAEMINRLIQAMEVVRQDNKPTLVLNIFNDKCYATPDFVRTAESAYDEVRPLIKKNAIIGLSDVQKMILKGFTILGNRELRNFESFDESIRFLVE